MLGIRYNKLVLTADKVSYILKNNIQFLFEDTDEYFLMLPKTTTVFKIREDRNLNFETHKWTNSYRNTEMIDEK